MHNSIFRRRSKSISMLLRFLRDFFDLPLSPKTTILYLFGETVVYLKTLTFLLCKMKRIIRDKITQNTFRFKFIGAKILV